MSDHANDVTKQYQAWAQQSWDAWMQSLQRPASPFAAAPAPADDLLSRAMGGLKSYADWMQAAATSGIAGQGPDDWQQALRQLFMGQAATGSPFMGSPFGASPFAGSPFAGAPFGGMNSPFAQAFAGIDSSAAHGFAQQWQSWLQAAQPQAGAWGAGLGDTPAFGYTRERQMQQQALLEAMRAYADASSHYNTLIQRANADGFERLREKLTQMTEPARQVDSLKALYDLWVDAAEEAYAEIALSDEFREAYGAMVNTQMQVRQRQQRQTDAWCRELGMPTRGEVDSLGKRVQQLRRELRAAASGSAPRAAAPNAELDALRGEVAALKRKLAGRAEASHAPKKVLSESLGAEVESESARKRKPASARRTVKAAPTRGTQRTRK
ncbi:poly(R)-hydroxyalkanoic acid synthase subunit PhaE [Dyella sp. 2RAB6]|uniref:poly(R)-hydroxyalkanoic acid synthase subunit PhaE n=1 Tax=Dyella sp. 2RAB6 TaxID=3232992 RepID=UPI003F8FCB8C